MCGVTRITRKLRRAKARIKGTSNFKDVMTDAKLLLGYNDKRFNEPKDILERKLGCGLSLATHVPFA